MAPKKGKKKAQDDWEAELGETIAPLPVLSQAQADAAEANGDEGDATGEDGSGGGGGLMAMLRKNKEKRKRKGLPEEDAPAIPDPDSSGPAPLVATGAAAPTEATMEDEFALPRKKGEADGKAKPSPAKKPSEDIGDDGRLLTKAEKEKLKKEREKQRKKEQVSDSLFHPVSLQKHSSRTCRMGPTMT